MTLAIKKTILFSSANERIGNYVNDKDYTCDKYLEKLTNKESLKVIFLI